LLFAAFFVFLKLVCKVRTYCYRLCNGLLLKNVVKLLSDCMHDITYSLFFVALGDWTGLTLG